MESNNKDLQAVTMSVGINTLKREAYEDKAKANAQATPTIKETPSVPPPAKKEQRIITFPPKQDHEVNEGVTYKGKAVASGPDVVPETVQSRLTSQPGNLPQTKDLDPSRKYHGPLFAGFESREKKDKAGSCFEVTYIPLNQLITLVIW